jgi:RND superfamily putative drug exporter
MRQSSSTVLPRSSEEAIPPRHSRRPVVERIAGWSARHRKTAVFGWLLLIAALFVVGQSLGTKSVPGYDAGQSGQAERTLHQLTSNAFTPATESVLIQARSASSGAAGSGAAGIGSGIAARQAASQVEAALKALPAAAAQVSAPRPSADGRSLLVTFTVPGGQDNASTTVEPAQRAVAAVQARYRGLTVAEAGDASISGALNNAIGDDFHQAEETSVPVTLILLLVVFGSLIAAGIPVLLALTAVVAAISMLSVVGQYLPVSSSTSEVVLIIGMAVGVDYSLFYLRREREERARGASVSEALRIAAGTSGKAIVVSGLTVMVALAGLFLTGLTIFDGVALGSIAVVGIAVAGSLTVLPALLSWLGPRAHRGRIPLLRRRSAATHPSRMWAALVRQVVKHPLAWGGVASLLLLALAAPAVDMRIGQPAIDAPKGLAVVATADRIQQAFPQAPSPASVVVTGDVHAAGVPAALDALRHDVTGVGVTSLAGGRALLVSVPLAGDGANTASDNSLIKLRNKILPSTLGKVPGLTYAVTGDTASNYDFSRQMDSRVPIVFGAVAAAAFVLLAIAFGSLAIPLVSILLNLLSVGAAYGLITLIFQDGRLQGPLDYTSFGGIINWIPLFIFVFLFGISMDYHVFLLSRIRELWRGGSSSSDAVVNGIASSAGVVTSAALIMVAVFSIFAAMSFLDLKILGIGMASAVLIDATVVRGILLPAALALLGDRAWGRSRRRRQAGVGQTGVGVG